MFADNCWTEIDLNTYEDREKKYQDRLSIEEAKLERWEAESRAKQKAAEAKGREEGREEGKNARNIEIAHNLLMQRIDVSTISSVTGLSISEIEMLSSEYNNPK